MAYNITKMKSTSTTKKILFFAAIIVCIITIQNLARSIYDLWHKQDLVVSAKKDLEREKEKNQRLRSELSYVQSQEFIESEARNKLFMVKPGESGVIVPPDLIKEKEEKREILVPNWQKWINLFGF